MATPKARIACSVLAVAAAPLAYDSVTTAGGFVRGVLFGYLAILAGAFALRIKARLGLFLVGLVFAGAYLYHLYTAK